MERIKSDYMTGNAHLIELFGLAVPNPKIIENPEIPKEKARH